MSETPGSGRRTPREHHLIAKLEERRERHKRRPWVVRAAVVIVGALVTLAGVIMTGPVPGPGFLVIPVGLAILALEFVWAERLLEKAVDWAEATREKAANQTRGQKIAGGVLTAIAIAAFAAAAILWDIPVLPV
ncbi:MAG TPA: PGPGW domain-containing protein [Thermoleophilaceae bacterium]|nr:PGPGW domain-containing protein [Thermoleophilaceae bacterium]